MSILHDSLEDLVSKLREAEQEKSLWNPIADLIIENLPTEIDKLKVC